MSTNEDLLNAFLASEPVNIDPKSRTEAYLKACCNRSGIIGLPEPISRNDELLFLLVEKMSENNLFDPDVNEISIDYGVQSATITQDGFTTVRKSDSEIPSEPGSSNWSSGWVYLSTELEAGKEYVFAFTAVFKAQKFDFDFPIEAKFGIGSQFAIMQHIYSVNKLNKPVAVIATVSLEEDVSQITFTVNDCDVEIKHLYIAEI